MPIVLEIDHEHQAVKATATGRITIGDVRSHLSEEDAERGLCYREMIDATQATVQFSSEDVRTILGILRQLARKGALGPTAVIVGNEFTYGMLRMLEILLEMGCMSPLRPFRVTEKAEAEHWLANAKVVRPTSALP
jgi:hypothetical protein